ncbi:hypothetical protein I302_103943 [Kwoniella bestiolae CBS 10118]|uniref:Myb-like domain-containing protein n=1 Tax=Kwoniella bestiolae CBS 10118 TaxID=1296100 RepID=A0A1B9G9Z4_9TREE|nr:hypothetical protein I302_02649 [Kwoniella bestiolae CBS 10118]OCF27800.1 hypothetical protein I302_02649 [Kwoniella bestiolae CBS 10118]
MPRQIMNTFSPQSKPYNRPSTPISDTKPKLEAPSKPKRSRADTPSKKWTSEELLALFNHVLKNGQRDWDRAVEGRTANQCCQTWTKTLLPYIKQSIESKGA